MSKRTFVFLRDRSDSCDARPATQRVVPSPPPLTARAAARVHRLRAVTFDQGNSKQGSTTSSNQHILLDDSDDDVLFAAYTSSDSESSTSIGHTGHPSDTGLDTDQVAAVPATEILELGQSIEECLRGDWRAMDRCHRQPVEVEEGNVEYKLRLIKLSANRLHQLTTQMRWRLEEGNYEAIYRLGVHDEGDAVGISREYLLTSLQYVAQIATSLGADVVAVLVQQGWQPDSFVAHVLIRLRFSATSAPSAGSPDTGLASGAGVTPSRRNPAEASRGLVSGDSRTGDPADAASSRALVTESRCVVVGGPGTGKSTLVGVLTQGGLDNGRGLKRLEVLQHMHEIEDGRTSSIGKRFMGFAEDGRVLQVGDDEYARSEEDVLRDAAHIVSFFDLAGHERYLKTTIFGLMGQLPDFAMLVIDAQRGLDRMSGEHLAVAVALNMPIVAVVSKCDEEGGDDQRRKTVQAVTQSLRSPGCGRAAISVDDMDTSLRLAQCMLSRREVVPLFQVSCVKGTGLDLLQAFLRHVPERPLWRERRQQQAEFYIDGAYQVQGGSETIVAGTVFSGTVRLNDSLLLGPDGLGSFSPVIVHGIHNNKVPVAEAVAGQSATLALRVQPPSDPAVEHKSGTTGGADVAGMGKGKQKQKKLSAKQQRKLLRKAFKSNPEPGAKPLIPLKLSAVRKGMALVHPAKVPAACLEFEAEVLVLNDAKGCVELQPGYQPIIHCRTVHQAATVVRIGQDNSGTWEGLAGPVTAAAKPARTRTSSNCAAHELGAGTDALASTVLTRGESAPAAPAGNRLSNGIARQLSGGVGGRIVPERLRAGDHCVVRFRFAHHPEYIQEGSSLVLRDGRARGVGRVVAVFT